MSLKNRKVIKEEIVSDFLDGLDLGKKKREHPIRWWFSKWFYYKPSWGWQEFSFWARKKWQVFRSGYSHYDAWDFKSQHAKWCVPRLKHLRDNHIGFPAMLDAPEETERIGVMDSHSIAPEEGNKESEDYHDKQNKKWENILDKMIWSFEHLDDLVEPIYPDDYDRRQKKTTYDDGCVAYESLDDRGADYGPITDHNKKVQEGLDLFAKHYQDLWD